MKCYNYEIYTCHPDTKEEGWEIRFVNVFAVDYKQAREALKTVPLFDVVILHNWTIELEPLDHLALNKGLLYRFTDNKPDIIPVVPRKSIDEAKDAFEHAINTGRLSKNENQYNYAGNFMYMGTTSTGKATFKHSITREYID